MMNMKKQITTLFTSALLTAMGSQTFAATSTSVSEIQVVGLFKNAAVLNINNTRKLIRVGDNNGIVNLLSANSDKATVEVGGKRYELAMAENTGIRVGLPSSNNAQAHLISRGGMYSVTGTINNQLVDFVVDTGASYITMNAQHAKRLRLDYSKAKKVMMNTAKGKTTAHVFNVASVRIGGIELKNVQAAVVHELESSKMLLGMSFLKQVEMQQKNGLMVLRKTG